MNDCTITDRILKLNLNKCVPVNITKMWLTNENIMSSYPGIVNICLKNYRNIDIIRHILRNIDTVVVVCNNTEKALGRYCCSISYLYLYFCQDWEPGLITCPARWWRYQGLGRISLLHLQIALCPLHPIHCSPSSWNFHCSNCSACYCLASNWVLVGTTEEAF